MSFVGVVCGLLFAVVVNIVVGCWLVFAVVVDVNLLFVVCCWCLLCVVCCLVLLRLFWVLFAAGWRFLMAVDHVVVCIHWLLLIVFSGV